MSKKQIVLYSILTGLAVALVVIALFLPVVQVVGHLDDAEQTIVYNKNVSLFVYLIDMPFLLTDAGNVYFHADGPIWMATLSIMLNVLLVVAGIVLLIACVYQLATMKMKNSATRNNVLAKKLSYFVGWLCVAVSLFAIASCTVTTLLSNGYAEFLFSFGEIVLFALGVAIITLAKHTDKRAKNQVPSKLKNALGFGLAALFAAFVVVLAFVPLYQEYIFGPEYASIFEASSLATFFANDPDYRAMLADYVFGISTYVLFAVAFIAAFVFVYAVIGFILTLANKKTNWLSGGVKRWSMALLVLETIVCVFVIAEIAVVLSSLTIPEGLPIMTFWAYVIPFAAYLPYVVSTMISVNKKNKNGEELNDAIAETQETPKEKAEEAEQEDKFEPEQKKAKKPRKKRSNKPSEKTGWLAENEIPNDVTKPIEKDVTRNLVDEPRPTPTENE